jgi:hypothetical protein
MFLELSNGIRPLSSRKAFGMLTSFHPFPLSISPNISRLSYGVIGRLPRVVPEPGAFFNGFAIPAGVRPPSPSLSYV